MSTFGPFGPGAFRGTDSFSGTGSLLELVAYITHTVGGVTSFDAQLRPIPEPATMFLLGTGLVSIAAPATLTNPVLLPVS